jgi:hypothetical protein
MIIKFGNVIEAKHLRRLGSATHAVITEVGEKLCRLRSVRVINGKAEFFPGAQSRDIPMGSIPKRYKPTNITMKLD